MGGVHVALRQRHRGQRHFGPGQRSRSENDDLNPACVRLRNLLKMAITLWQMTNLDRAVFLPCREHSAAGQAGK